jgi:hypothetical protein
MRDALEEVHGFAIDHLAAALTELARALETRAPSESQTAVAIRGPWAVDTFCERLAMRDTLNPQLCAQGSLGRVNRWTNNFARKSSCAL